MNFAISVLGFVKRPLMLSVYRANEQLPSLLLFICRLCGRDLFLA
jgi:hypothetical protein